MNLKNICLFWALSVGASSALLASNSVTLRVFPQPDKSLTASKNGISVIFGNKTLEGKNEVSYLSPIEVAYLKTKGQLDTSKGLYPKAGHSIMTVKDGDTSINFFSIAGNESVWNFIGLKETITIKELSKNLLPQETSVINVVKAHSLVTARKAASLNGVDLVLIDSNKSFTETWENTQIIAISPEKPVDIFLTKDNNAKVKISSNYFNPKSLPANERLLPQTSQKYSKDVFNNIRANLILEKSKAHLAIIASSKSSLNQSQITFSQFRNEVSQNSFVASVKLLGSQIKELEKAVSNDLLVNQYFIKGIENKKINQRAINDKETYIVAMDEHALNEIFHLSALGALNYNTQERAPYIELVTLAPASLLFIAGQKTQTNSYNPAKSLVVYGKDTELVEAFLESNLQENIENYITKTTEFRPTWIFSLNNLDIGITNNFTNKQYESYQKGADLQVGRSTAPVAGQALVHSDMALTFDAGAIETTLSKKWQFYQSDLLKKPERDKLVVGLNFRLPWERCIFNDSPHFYVSPILNSSYETKAAPYLLSYIKDLPEPTKKLNQLLGTRFDIKKAFLGIDAGAAFQHDFKKKGYKEIFSYGPGVNVDFSLPIYGPLAFISKIKAQYYFSVNGAKMDKKSALNIESTNYLRLAQLGNFSVSLLGDILAASAQKSPEKVAFSSILGVTVSYSDIFKLN